MLQTDSLPSEPPRKSRLLVDNTQKEGASESSEGSEELVNRNWKKGDPWYVVDRKLSKTVICVRRK